MQEAHRKSPQLAFLVSPGSQGLEGRGQASFSAGSMCPVSGSICRYCWQVSRHTPILSYISMQSDPEFAQWLKELTCTFNEAQRLLRRAPKFLNKPRAAILEFSKPPLCHRNSSGL